jgi:hypothetical protein
MRLPNQGNLNSAQDITIKEFPGDTKIVWQAAKTTDPSNACYQMEVQSPTLGNQLSDHKIGNSIGRAFIEFSSVTKGISSTYDSNNVNDALIQLGSYATISDAPGC